MDGRATLTMKKSIRGSAAPSSTVNSPSGPITAPWWVTGTVGEGEEVGEGVEVVRTVVSLTEKTILPFLAWYQSLLILVQLLPGNWLTSIGPYGTLKP
ncbi:hypothetical protein GCM10010326_17030 [Streptomyces xanthochromogenes]|uniref:Uncharacterized protein n=1 Tax=Streptomyces xanthochromogenes TaxID=67384 RepID=A0ABQ2ZVF7_9ACTN|nr:hypothetical protein GCM10010326_17030 [Streptomyces xanthochromogenes]